MNTQKILELLGTTSDKKMQTLKREMTFPATAEESANDLLNAELYGTRKSATESKKEVPHKPVKKAEESVSAKEEITPVEQVDKPGKHFDACPKEARDFLVKLLNVINSGDCKKAKHILVEFMGMAPASSTEMVVEAQTENFPSTFDFDEEKFAEDYEIDKDSITCIHIPEDPEAKIEEHIEVSFKAVEDDKESTVVLSIAPDMLVSETIDAEVIEPAQFSAAFVEEEDEQGEMRTRLVLTLVDEGEETVEETDVVMSEGDVDHVDENGDATTDEFIEEAGLNLDPFYSKQHDMKVADKGAHESLAAKIIRSSK